MWLCTYSTASISRGQHNDYLPVPSHETKGCAEALDLYHSLISLNSSELWAENYSNIPFIIIFSFNCYPILTVSPYWMPVQFDWHHIPGLYRTVSQPLNWNHLSIDCRSTVSLFYVHKEKLTMFNSSSIVVLILFWSYDSFSVSSHLRLSLSLSLSIAQSVCCEQCLVSNEFISELFGFWKCIEF